MPMRRGEVFSVQSAVEPVEAMQAALADKLDEVNALIESRMQSENAPRIPEVTNHLIGAGGKRVRPMLTLAAAALFGYRGQSDAKLAATVEFIHTATLLHDDVVDESAQRRGRPSANLLWDNKSSVLVGDYLFARAFQLMVETDTIRVLDILANASAVIAEGEVLQLSAAQSLATGEDTYLKIIRGKTAALFAAAAEVGGVIAGADESHIDALRDYGGTAAVMGKNTGDDFRERKLTLPTIKAIAAADAPERAFWARVIEAGDQNEGDLEEAIALLGKHGTLDATREEALDWEQRAQSALERLPQHPMRDHLAGLASFVVARLY